MKYSFSITRLPFALLLALLAVAHSCKETAPSAPTTPEPPLPPQPIQTISLTVVDSASVEAWLKLSIPDTVKERRYRLFLNDSLIWQATLTKPDTLMLIGLAPAATYRARAERLTTDTFNVTVDEKTFRTLDTTSQDYTWQYLRFGVGASYFRDVCIINDTCIWAVGRIDSGLYDSLGVPIVYNAMRYDGKRWEYFALGFPFLSGTDTVLIPFEAFSVFGFSPSDIWFSDGGSYLHWDGNRYRKHAFAFGSGFSGGLKMWGTSSSNLYSINNLGYIMHYDGAVWRRMESGTTTNLTDISGTPDGESVWVAGYTNNQLQSCLLSLENGQWQSIWRFGQPPYSSYRIFAMWAYRGSAFLVFEDGVVFTHQLLNSDIPIQWFGYVPGTRCAGGSARNNVAFGGEGGRLRHHNGRQWKAFGEVQNPDRSIRAIDVSDKLIIAVGQSYEPTLHGAMVLFGRKP